MTNSNTHFLYSQIGRELPQILESFETLKAFKHQTSQIPKNSEGSRKLSSFFVKSTFKIKPQRPLKNFHQFKIKPRRPLKKVFIVHHSFILGIKPRRPFGSTTSTNHILVHPKLKPRRPLDQQPIHKSITYEDRIRASNCKRDCNPKINTNITLYTLFLSRSFQEFSVFTNLARPVGPSLPLISIF